MFRKNYLLIIFSIALLLTGSVAAFAQTAPLSGRVELKKEDGSKEPVEGALVEVFRVDQKASFPSDKTDKKGNFTFAGLPLGGSYVLSISAAGIRPELSQNLRAGTNGVVISVSEGDGRVLTEDEVRKVLDAAATNPSGELTAEQKKKQAEFDKELAEAQAKNANIENTNALVTRLAEEGIAAFNAKNYDLAAAKFDEAIIARPDFVGSTPGLLNNKGASLVNRAVANYNRMVTSTDAALKSELAPKIRDDFENALAAYAQAWEISSSATAEEIVPVKKSYDASRAETLRNAQDAVYLMARTDNVVDTQKDIAVDLVATYVATETDKAKKEKAQIGLGNYLLKAYDYDAAVIQFRKAFDMNSKNPDAVAGLALALYTASAISEDMAQKQEALNYMQYFLDIAPADHPFKKDGSIEGGVDDLKSQKLKPQKIVAKN